MNHLQVAAGILLDAAGKVLIAERRCDGPFDGLWEFPGGKIASGESSGEALSRELAEEIGIEITASRFFMRLYHEYPDRSVDIEFYLVDEWRQDPVGREGQQLRWVDADQLDAAEMLPADMPVVDAIRKLRSGAAVEPLANA
jgi:8-oxo-dGTP diphosphatase